MFLLKTCCREQSTAGWEQSEWSQHYLAFVPLFDSGTIFSSHCKLSLTKCLPSLNMTFIVGKKGSSLWLSWNYTI